MVNIGIVDDHVIVREGFKRLIELEPDLEVAAEYGSYDDAIKDLPKQSIEVLVVDILLLGKSGLELIQYVRETHPEIRNIVVSMYDNEPYVSEACSMGAQGYLSKRVASEELIKAIRQVCLGELYISQDVIDNIQQHQLKPEESNLEELTKREMGVFKLLAKGLSTKTIASNLSISPKTVYVHRTSLFNKLGLTSQHELLKYALINQAISFNDLID